MSFCKSKKVKSLIGAIALAIVLCISIPAPASATTFLGMEVSGKGAQANVSNFFNTLSIRVFCGLTGLFANTCEEQGIGQVETTVQQNIVTVQNTSVVAAPVQPTVTPVVQVTGADVRQTVVERIVERVVSPVGIAGVSQEYVDGRLAALATELRGEMTDRTITVRTSSGSSNDNFSRQIDSVYDDMSENINDAVLDLQDEDEVLALIAANQGTTSLATFDTDDLAEGSTNLYSQWGDVVGGVSYSGNVTATAFYGDGSNLTGITSFSTTTTRAVFSSAAPGLTYTSGTGAFSLTSGYEIPTTASTTEWTSKVSSQWATSGSNISYTAGNVGIGTTTPGSLLTVAGDSLFSGTSGAVTTTMNVTSQNLTNAGASFINVTAGTTAGGISARNQVYGFHDMAGATVVSGSNRLILNSGASAQSGVTTDDISFRTGGYGSSQEKMRLTNAGNLGIGTTTPGAKLHALATTEQLRLGYSGSNYLSMTVGSTGIVTLNAVGEGAALSFSDNVTVPNLNVGSFNIDGTTGLFNGTAQTANNAYTGATSGAVLAVNNGSNYVYDDNANALYAVFADSAGYANYTNYGAVSGLTLAVNNLGYVYDDNATPLSSQYADTAGSASNASAVDWGTFFVGGGATLNAGDNPITGISLGSASAPSISFMNDDNTGIWSPGADTLALSTDGSERLRITSAGNVGIGTTTPATKLDVVGGANIGTFVSTSGLASINTSILNVGSPTAVNAASTGTEAALRLVRNGTSGTKYAMSADFNIGTYATGLAAQSQLDIRLGNGNILTPDTTVMSLLGNGNVGVGTTSPSAKLAITGTAGTGDIFTIASSTNVRYLTVTAAGNLGIGTESPAYKLHLSDSVNNYQLRIGGTSTFNYDIGRSNFDGYFNFYGNRTGSVGYVFGGVDGERMRLTFAGDLGIGTTTPGARLNVVSRSVASTTAMFTGFSSDQTADILQLAKNPGATPGFVYTAAGNVGIGTTTPGSLLTVAGNILSTGQIVGTATTSNSFPAFAIAGDTDTGFSYSSSQFKLTKDGSNTFVVDTLLQYTYFLHRMAGITGTAAAPAFGYINENGIGMYRASTGVLAFSTGSTARMVIDSTGNTGIGTTTPARRLHVYTSADEAPVRFEDSSGWCEINPTSTTWSCTSDERLKDNIQTLFAPEKLAGMLELRPVEFTWKSDDSDTVRTGLIAQEVERIFPELVNTDERGYKSVSYGGFTVYLISALQELATKIESIAAWFGEGRFNVSGDVCVDEVCVTKDEFKNLLRNGANVHEVIDDDENDGGGLPPGETSDGGSTDIPNVPPTDTPTNTVPIDPNAGSGGGSGATPSTGEPTPGVTGEGSAGTSSGTPESSGSSDGGSAPSGDSSGSPATSGSSGGGSPSGGSGSTAGDSSGGDSGGSSGSSGGDSGSSDSGGSSGGGDAGSGV